MLVARLAALPPETDPSYGIRARALLADPATTDEALGAVLADLSNLEQIRFHAFYCLQTRAWRRRDHRAHRANVDRYQSEFGSHPMFFFMQAEYYSSLDGEPANRQAALTFAPEAVRRLSSIPGVLHLAASVIADHHEADADADPRLLLEGERLVRQAIALSNGTYPRYHATHARIATLRGAYGAARASIGRAIEEEDSSGAEYALRIGDYQLIRARILHAQQAETLRAGQSEATAELRRIRAQILEIMGLLAAVIAFITTAANITAGQPPGPAAGLLTTAGGVTLLVFWGSWILGDVPEAARHARCLSVPLAGGEEVLVCSDGFARLVEPFGLVDGYAALLRAVRGGAGAAGDLVERKNHRRHRSDPAPTVAAWRFI